MHNPFTKKLSMYATTTKKFITRHSKYAWALTLVAVLIVSGIYLKKEFTGAVGHTFVQNNWSGGFTANTANNTSNQTNWSEFATSTDISGGTTISLETQFFVDDFVCYRRRDHTIRLWKRLNESRTFIW